MGSSETLEGFKSVMDLVTWVSIGAFKDFIRASESLKAFKLHNAYAQQWMHH